MLSEISVQALERRQEYSPQLEGTLNLFHDKKARKGAKKLVRAFCRWPKKEIERNVFEATSLLVEKGLATTPFGAFHILKDFENEEVCYGSNSYFVLRRTEGGYRMTKNIYEDWF